jgi:hypothetical protein
LFSLKKNVNIDKDLNSFVSNHILLSISKENLNRLIASKKENINLRIPVAESNFVDVEMSRVTIRTNDFAVKSLSDNRLTANIDDGLHYRGIIRGKSDSWAAFSFFKDNVMGMIASEGGDYILGAIRNANKQFTTDYVFYNDNDLLKSKDFVCGVNEKEDLFVRNYKNSVKISEYHDGIRTIDTVGIYFETDYQMYDDFGGNLNSLVNYVNGIFNQVAAIYQNESLPIKISQIGYWNTVDPYANDSDSYVSYRNLELIHRTNSKGTLRICFLPDMDSHWEELHGLTFFAHLTIQTIIPADLRSAILKIIIIHILYIHGRLWLLHTKWGIISVHIIPMRAIGQMVLVSVQSIHV